jgi:hypothetical protein
MSQIRIANPSPGQAQRVTNRQAERYIRKGAAIKVGNELHFTGSVRLPSDVYIAKDSKWNMFIANSRQCDPATNDIFPHYVWDRGLV